ncbi:MAG: threonine--tRNA ligase [Gammaproteobacteria bacterium]|nr:MAG: threonine--tRNA ligase [Gammaproteobacteria bacterium]
MPDITLPDGSIKNFDKDVSIADVALAIGSGLFKVAVAGCIDGVLYDTSHIIKNNIKLSIITSQTDEGVQIIRHSTAHLLAHAVKQLYPKVQVTIGPVIDYGFYYDFATSEPFTPEDLTKIENKMQELVKKDIPLIRTEMNLTDVIDYFNGINETYKTKIIADLDKNQPISLYTQDDFTDLCRGPHVPSTGFLGHFKLTKIAGSYWRGDSNNEMLQRIYGVAFSHKKQLKQHLNKLDEAKKRDHRKLATALNLFHLQPESPGMVFWHNDGWIIYNIIVDYIRKILNEKNYTEVRTPEMVDRSLWERSGHWDKFKEQMFTTSVENREYAIKPMNCPCHIQIYNTTLTSYKDLPLRMAEFGSCHRNEPSGTLHGLMRLRNFIQDDAHIFCSKEQISSEVLAFIDLVYEVYRHFGFNEIEVALSTRPAKRVGDDKIWDEAEKALEDALQKKQIKYEIKPGEGAFYGPKIEFSLKDCLDRVWQCGTMQVDFSMPGRLDATYIDKNGDKKTPVMLHRAILGSIERFIGILIEHYAGKLPFWLAPVQVIIANISEQQQDYASEILQELKKLNIRAKSDFSNEKISYKIRKACNNKTPFMMIIGDKEMESGTITARSLSGENKEFSSVKDFKIFG